MEKLRLALIFGGQSAEHEVSLRSARSVLKALNPDRFKVTLIGITPEGSWHLCSESDLDPPEGTLQPQPLQAGGPKVFIAPGDTSGKLLRADGSGDSIEIDVAFPILHGPKGEDGTVQGLLQLVDIPFVGANSASSAICMDKDVAKRLFQQGGIPTARFCCVARKEAQNLSFEQLVEELGLPLFIKPVFLGSSVGVSRVVSREEFQPALTEALNYDHRVIIEEAIEGREIECSVLGNDSPRASLPGEIRPKHSFYSYDAKYLDADGASLLVPAPLSGPQVRLVQEMAIKTYRLLGCEGMARIDCFLRQDEIFVNEVNTIPGFTDISMYPKLWEASGLPYTKLIDELVDLALERFQRDQGLRVLRIESAHDREPPAALYSD